MPRYYNNRRRRRGRRVQRGSATPWYNKKYSVGEVAQAAWRGVQYIKTLVNSEVHKLDTTFSTTADSAGFVTHLTAIAQGDTVSNRTGNSVLLSYLTIKSLWAINSLNVTAFIRILIVRDKQQVGDSSPTITDILETIAVTSHYDITTVGRFQILLDKMFDLNSNGKQTHIFKKTINLKKHVRFNGTASSDIQKGGIYFIAFSDQGTNIPAHVTNVRIAWHDN